MQLRDPAALLAALTALAVRLFLWSGLAGSVLFLRVEGGHDRALYHQAALSVAQGAWWPAGSFDYLPLYPWVLGLLYRLCGPSLQMAAALGIVADSLTAFLLVRLARRLGASTPWALLAGLAFAAYPRAMVYATLTMPVSLNILLVTSLAYVLSHPGPRTTRGWMGVGFLSGLAGLGYPAVWPALLVVAAWLFRPAQPSPPGAVRLAALLGTALLMVLPVVIHNTRAEGQLTLLSTHGGINVYLGNHERATGYPLRIRNFRMTAREMLEDAHRAAEQETGRTLTKAQSSAWWSAQARRFLREQPGAALRLTLRKIRLFWSGTEVDDLRMLEQVRIMNRQLTGAWWPSFGLFSVAGLFGLLRTRGALPARLFFGTSLAAVVALFITTRYRLPLVPLLAALGAAGLTRLARDVRTRQHLAGHGLALVAAVLLVLPGSHLPDLRGTDYYNASVQWLAASQTQRALESARAGLVLDKGNADLHHAEGSALFHLQQYDDATRSFTRALELRPQHPQARFNLALSLARANRACEALRVLEQNPRPEPRTQELMETLRGLCGKTQR